MDPWKRVAGELRQLGSGHDHADDVQEALLRTLRRLGRHADSGDACRLGRAILPRVQADRLRRRRHERLTQADELASDAIPSHTEPLNLRRYLGPVLVKGLGRRGLLVLEQIFAGVRTNKELARVLATSPAAIRKRRERIRNLLKEHAGSFAE